MIKITLKDGTKKEFKKGTTGLEIAESISKSLAKSTIVTLQDGNVVDLLTPIINDVNKFELITDSEDKDALSVLRHSTAHVLAKAIVELYPQAQLSIGPSIEEGFYYDIDFGDESFSENDFPKVEQKMKKIIAGGDKFIRKEVEDKYLLNLFKDNHYKTTLIKDLKDAKLTSYTLGSFEDLCKGPHLNGIGKISHFKLTHLSGAYFRGDSKQKQLTRIYGTAFFGAKQLENHLTILSERSERDHRKIGKQLDIFMFNELGGRGFPYWMPNGLKIKNRMKELFNKFHLLNGYVEIESPIVGDKVLYETSGHLDHYEETMFPSMKFDDEEIYLRPMSCPHHCLYFANELRSYNDLPLRICENVKQYRYEKSGALRGLERVRAMELTDSHIFITPDQIKSEVSEVISSIQKILKIFDIEIDYIELALRDKEDKEKYHHDDEKWNKSEVVLREVLNSSKIKYKEMIGEAAFYGPKIDIQVKTALGHSITMSTIQLDFLLPEKFNLSYKDSNQENKTPVLIHRGLIGTYERFISILLEQTKGVMPFWLAPQQIAIIPVNNNLHQKESLKIKDEFINNDVFNVIVDNREERLSYKIRQHQTNKVKYQIVIGDNEVKNNQITFREYGSEKETTMDRKKFLARIIKENKLPLLN